MPMILNALPTPAEFFQTYWNKKPFVVRGMIPKNVTETLIDADHLAGLAMEEDVKSRLVRKGGKPSDWACDFGPFDEEIFDTLGDSDWSLLVQNIDQYHAETAELLKQFSFCPRWLLDDIMVSFSPNGGTVGEHVDSYHVFLIQGMGERRWKVAYEPIKDENYIEDIPLEILKEPFEGEEITVTEGDVIYIPPKFAHQGVSLQPSLTYSVGFLGPSLSEMLGEFSHYIEEHHDDFPRYLGQNLTQTASPFQVGAEHIDDLKSFMTTVFDQDLFSKWLTQYFSSPTHIPDEESSFEEAPSDAEGLIADKIMLIKPPAVKMMLSPLKAPNMFSVSINGYSFELDAKDLHLINAMAQEGPFSGKVFDDHTELLNNLLARGFIKLLSD